MALLNRQDFANFRLIYEIDISANGIPNMFENVHDWRHWRPKDSINGYLLFVFGYDHCPVWSSVVVHVQGSWRKCRIIKMRDFNVSKHQISVCQSVHVTLINMHTHLTTVWEETPYCNTIHASATTADVGQMLWWLWAVLFPRQTRILPYIGRNRNRVLYDYWIFCQLLMFQFRWSLALWNLIIRCLTVRAGHLATRHALS